MSEIRHFCCGSTDREAEIMGDGGTIRLFFVEVFPHLVPKTCRMTAWECDKRAGRRNHAHDNQRRSRRLTRGKRLQGDPSPCN